MTRTSNRQVILNARPVGSATVGDFQQSDLAIVEREMPVLNDGEVLIRNILFSVDPFQRTVMGNTPSETTLIEIGDVMRGATVGVVEQTRNPRFAVGEHVNGWLGWQQFAKSDGIGLRKVDATAVTLSTALGVLGHTGLTAWLGASKLMAPKPGGTFVATNAAGSVGSLAVQIAKLRGHRVVAIAGGAAKVAYMRDELGVDVAVDYKAESFEQDLAKALPDGIDRLLDSVGATMFEALMPFFNTHAKAIIIGQIALFGTMPDGGADRLPELLNLIQYRDLEVKGVQLPDYFHTYPEFLQELTPLVANGSIKYREEIIDGFDMLPLALPRLFDGSNSGKLIVRV